MSKINFSKIMVLSLFLSFTTNFAFAGNKKLYSYEMSQSSTSFGDAQYLQFQTELKEALATLDIELSTNDTEELDYFITFWELPQGTLGAEIKTENGVLRCENVHERNYSASISRLVIKIKAKIKEAAGN